MNKITDSVIYIGANDYDLDLFEGQYDIPNGVSYNSYVILDEKIAIMDTIDKRKSDEWFANLEEALAGRQPDYLVVSHVEPDHGASIVKAMEKYPSMQMVISKKALGMLPQFFDKTFEDRALVVAEKDELCLGSHTLVFVMAPLVHWPEVMVEYEKSEKILFSADAFGKFGTLDTDEDWACEARRYYFNIVGKYGVQAQALLKKAAALDIDIICPLHGPILKEDLGYYIGKYDVWSRYAPEDDGVLIAYASMHGNTKDAAELMKAELEAAGAKKVAMADLARDDMAEAIEDAFRYDKLILACPTYDAGIMPFMMDFLYHLKLKNYQGRKVGIIENFSWGPVAAKIMKGELGAMKNITICENVVSIKSTMKDANREQIKALAAEILG